MLLDALCPHRLSYGDRFDWSPVAGAAPAPDQVRIGTSGRQRKPSAGSASASPAARWRTTSSRCDPDIGEAEIWYSGYTLFNSLSTERTRRERACSAGRILPREHLRISRLSTATLALPGTSRHHS